MTQNWFFLIWLLYAFQVFQSRTNEDLFLSLTSKFSSPRSVFETKLKKKYAGMQTLIHTFFHTLSLESLIISHFTELYCQCKSFLRFDLLKFHVAPFAIAYGHRFLSNNPPF